MSAWNGKPKTEFARCLKLSPQMWAKLKTVFNDRNDKLKVSISCEGPAQSRKAKYRSIDDDWESQTEESA